VGARPDVLVHQLTALPPAMDLRRYGEGLEPTNRLRSQTTPIFLAAAREAGVRRVVFQSVSFQTAPTGPPVHHETAPIITDPPSALRAAVAAIVGMERAVLHAEALEGVVLRYGFFYGPGTYYARDGSIVADVRRRRFPLVGDAAGRSSFVHVDDAAAATVLALDRGAPGIYNVTDDEPAPQSAWLPELARILGAPPPRRIPRWVARLAVGPHAVHLSTTLRGNANTKARRELGFAPRYPSYREGFAATLGHQPAMASAIA
ncbi:MAG TPA: NAD(P)-dependent oxidoreductase, partial [Solirubrobacteraceae bacterium]|nr:NAD(P)-dependent oxidoreductase [Solirubrobacteraceae bacterium]